ncbi:hypothetical protein [Vulcanisaeta souniana]|uniref:THUMP domain-containing protein n=1 Tax=Vulcanisaeta souniana JCM 11219 TaxID=1293586 RepID=A0A830E5W9_9CREN|nr:hypothetical protein [Vulcanisaeta souniana]BDR92232.1 hypothetical protein Vsou_13250 [Vulcanisaeta souniana JCM 11219]GGI86060.1 hypothetical protein GCM10007112_23820 [Vulcanisaeta souniana JCM 11219]
MDWRGILASIRGGEAGERDLRYLIARNALPFIINATKHPGLFVLTPKPGVKPTPLIEGFLMSLRLALDRMDPITLARPFNIVATLGEYKTSERTAYKPEDVIEDAIERLVLPIKPRRVRARVRAHGLGNGDAMRSLVRDALARHGVMHSGKASLVFNVEEVWVDQVRLYIGLFPKWLLVRYKYIVVLRRLRSEGERGGGSSSVPRAF